MSEASPPRVSKRLYLDYASSCPISKAAADKIHDLLEKNTFYDPGRNYQEALISREEIETAREKVALFLNSKPNEVIFTSSGTEAINMAARGARLVGGRQGGTDYSSALSEAEHQAVKKSARQNGYVVNINITPYGQIDLAHLKELLDGDQKPVLVHCQIANHEVGTIQPYKEAAALCERYGVFIHFDACMAAGYLPIDFAELGADFLSVSSHKLGGPPGAGALILKRNKRIEPILLGGAQERGKRAGFENILSIAGFAAACEKLSDPILIEKREKHFTKLHSHTLRQLNLLPGMEVYGAQDSKLQHIICFKTPGVNGEAILRELDRRSIAVHSGSACAAEAIEPSAVLESMGFSGDQSLRISFGDTTSKEDVDYFIFCLTQALDKYRRP
ncbi:MAG: cysteine desulfurase [Firmicutes bacterium]|nr:cysteine desulfurase [Bacillota bacterium]